MDIGLNLQQRIILRCARAKRLPGAGTAQIIPPLWAIAVVMLPPLLHSHPLRYLWVLVVPLAGFWQRRRVRRRIADWALDLREI